MKRVAVNVKGRIHHRLAPERRCMLSANDVSEVLDQMHVLVDERDLNGWRVGRLRLQLASGIGGLGGYFVKEVNGPRVRSRVAYTRADIRELCRDYFPRYSDRRRMAALGVTAVRREWLLPRRIDYLGNQIEPKK